MGGLLCGGCRAPQETTAPRRTPTASYRTHVERIPDDNQLPGMELTNVIKRVVREHRGWFKPSAQRLKDAERKYREFWRQCRRNPDHSFQPDDELVDAIWHAHILHTAQYEQDSYRYFGYFLHHTPLQAANAKCCNN